LKTAFGPVLAVDKGGKVIIPRKGGREDAARFINSPAHFPDHLFPKPLQRRVSQLAKS
jgi:hypothetical protein